MVKKVLNVSQILHLIKRDFEENYYDVWIEGEVVNLSRSINGHYYFNLSDGRSLINAVLFSGDALRNPEIKSLKDGDSAVVGGEISVYAPRGSFQIIIRDLKKSGKGNLLVQLEEMKKKLKKEGLFDQVKMKPYYPQKIAVISAPESAAWSDFQKVFSRKAKSGKVVLFPSLVQGDRASHNLINAINEVEKRGDFDVVILARGGGSLEDLWCFNDEKLVRRLAHLSLPMISAIGHEIDFTLCDFVADIRAETPTAAAEIIAEIQNDVWRNWQNLCKKLKMLGQQQYMRLNGKLDRCRPQKNYQILQLHLQNRKQILNSYKRQLKSGPRYQDKILELDSIASRLQQWSKVRTKSYAQDLEKWRVLLNGLGPRKVLERGYAIVKDPQGKPINKSVQWKKIKSGEKICIELLDGQGTAFKES